MDTNLSFFGFPFVDNEGTDTGVSIKNKSQDSVYDDIQNSLPSHSAYLGSDDVLAQILSADDPLEEPDLNGPTTLHCEICRKQFDNAKKYYGHLRVHSKDNLWICEKCPNQKFSTKQQLMKHSLIHTPLKRMWPCPQCTMAFEALWRLQQHLFIKHLNCRPHKCDQCDKTFHKKSDLKKHIDTHNNVKRHACSTCGVLFSDASNLKRHMLRHTGEKAYCCVGCRSGFKQLANLNRHKLRCVQYTNTKEPHSDIVDPTVRKNHCRMCGMTFQFKSALLEHCVRQHNNANEKNETKTNQTNTDTNRTVDNIVDDILSVEDDYLTMSTQTEMLNTYNTNETDNADNLMQIEFLKEMNQLHILDDELFYNDLDIDTLQSNQMFNMNTSDMDYNSYDKNTESLDFADYGKSVDHDIMNALYQVKAELLPDELLNVSDVSAVSQEPNQILENPTVTVNECATIFESDVDLEASTNLAANLNQLIGENSVQYISTEEDDTFIISLNSGIDVEQLTGMLNNGIKVINGKKIEKDVFKEDKAENVDRIGDNVNRKESVQIEIEKPIITISEIRNSASGPKINIEAKLTKSVIFMCRTCNKTFNKKDNFKSHLATHEPSLRRHVCAECRARFSYRSTLNKHCAARHSAHAAGDPPAAAPHSCTLCGRRFRAAWMLKTHTERDHEKLAPHKCDHRGCDKSFYKKCDLVVHKRSKKKKMQ